MKRKGSDFAGFFSVATGTQQVIDLGDSWVIDFQIDYTPESLRQQIAGRDVASLHSGYRWLYWVPKRGESTCLVFLDEKGKPVWCYADVIAGVGMDERGYPWTDDVYLDVVALCEVEDGKWVSQSAEIIDRDDLTRALTFDRITAAEAKHAEDVASSVQAALNHSSFTPLQRLEEFAGGIRKRQHSCNNDRGQQRL